MSNDKHDISREQPARPVLDLDGEDHNANWLRILADRRGQLPPSPFAQPPKKEQPNGRQQ